MLPIPPDPSQAQVPLVTKNAQELVEWWKRYFYYCPNPTCWYYQNYGVAFMSRNVEVDILVGR
jgi:siderophore synthetase component